MKNNYTIKASVGISLMFFMMLFAGGVKAQMSFFTFSQSAGTYTPITGGTVVAQATATTGAAAVDNVNYAALAIPFTFTFNGIGYTTVNANSNGFITFGATAPPTGSPFSPISDATAYDGAVSALGRDLRGTYTTTATRTTGSNTLTAVTNTGQIAIGDVIVMTGVPAGTTVAAIGAGTVTMSANATSTLSGATVNFLTGQIRTETIGTAPNQVFVIQYSRLQALGISNTSYSFQIRLYETSNNIEIVYGTFTSAGNGGTPQVGLRGASNTDFSNRTTTTNWSATTAGATNNATETLSTTVFPSSGQTYTWTLTPPCFGTPAGGTLPAMVNVCNGATTTLTATAVTAAPGTTYQWQTSSSPGGPYVNVTGGTGATTASYTTPSLTVGTYYYVLEVTCSAGPSTSLSSEATVIVNALPTVAVSPTTAAFCSGGTPVTLTASGASTYSWLPTAGLTPSTGAVVNAAPTAATTYTVTGTDVNGCTATATAAVTVITSPTLTATATPNSICSGGTSQLLATATLPQTYAESTAPFSSEPCPANPGPSGDDVLQGANAIGFSFDYYGVTYTQFGISTNGNIQLGDGSGNATNPTYNNAWTDVAIPNTGLPNNIVALAWDDWLVSAGQITWGTSGTAPNRKMVVCFNTTGRGGGSADTLNGQIVLEETTNNIYFNVIKKGNQPANTSTQGIENQGGTAGSMAVTGRNNQAWFANNNTTVLSPVPNPFTYAWAPPTFLSSTTIANPLATAVTASTTYTVTVTAASGCSVTATATVTVSPLSVSSTVAPSATVCEGVTVTFGSTPTGGGLPYTYSWVGPNSFASTLQNPTLVTSVAAVGTYTVTVTDACGSTSSSTVALGVNPAPPVAVTPATLSICQPGATAVTLTATGAATFVWGPAAGLSATTGSSVTALPGSTITYTVTGTDGIGCTATATSVITVIQTPVISSVTATPPSICIGGNSQLLATVPTAVSTYGFSTSTGATLDPMVGAAQVLNPGNDDTPTAAPAAIGFSFDFSGTSYTQFSVSPDGWILLGGATAANQFTNQVTSGINIPKIYPFWDDLATGSDGNVKTLVSGTAPNRILKVQWFVTVPRNTAGAANSTFQAWLYETTGVIEFRYGTMGVPSSGSISGGLTAGATNFHSITFSSNTSSTAAANDANSIAPASGRMYTYTPPSLTYSWTPPTFLSSATIANPMANGVTATTTYTVTVANGICSSTSTVTVTAGALLTTTSGVAPSGTVCSGETVTFSSTPTGGGEPYTYAWAGPNSFTSTLQNPTLVTSVAAAGTYTVTVTDNCAITATSTVTLTINALPTVAVTPTSGSYCNPGGTAVSLTASGTALTYAWLPVAGLSAATGTNVDATPAGTTTYTVSGTDGNGCVGTATTTITSNSALAFSSATATPSAVCVGSNSLLDAVAAPVISTYCTAGATSTGFEKIGNVTFGTINNTSTSTAGYEDFVAVSTNVTAAVSTPISIFVTNAWSVDDRIHIWIDMNQDGVFANPAENVMNAAISTFCAACSGVNTTVTGNITIPVTALNGATRMRIRLEDLSSGGNDTPCGTNTFGQTEDYTVNITAATATGISYLWSPATFLSSTTVSNPTATAVTASQTYTVTATSLAGCSATATVALTANPVPVATSVITTPIACAGTSGIVTVSATGGTTPYTGDGAMPTFAGAYSYTVTDVNGCSSTATGTITEPTPVVVTFTQTPVACTGGSSSVVISATGGTGTLTGTGPVSQTAGTVVYTVTDQNGCTGTASVTVTEPTVVSVTTAPGTIACFGGSATVVVNATGGTPGYTVSPTAPQFVGTTVYTVTDANGCTGTASVTLTEPTLLTASAAVSTPIACNGGSGMVTITGAGGTPAYSGATTFPQTAAAGTVTYTVTDANGCTATANIAITEPTPIVVSYSETGILCFGGSSSVTVSATGGTGTYAIPFSSGSNTFSQTASTAVYTVTDANGCTGSATVTVTQPALLVATADVTGSIVCNGDTAAVFIDATGGTTPFLLTSVGSFSQSAGAITYTVTDANGCTSDTTVTLTEPTAVMVMTSFLPVSCNGDSTLVTVTAMDGTPGYTGEGTFYQVGGTTTTYTVTDINGCIGAANVTVTQPAAITSAQSFNFCGSGSVTVGANTYTTAGTYTDVLTAAGSCDSTVTTTVTVTNVDATTTTSLSVITANSVTGTFQWINCGTNTDIAGETASSYTAMADGSYAVEVTDNGCVDTSACVMIIGAGIADVSQNTVSVYPNPTMGAFNITVANANIAELVITVTDIQGKVVFTSADKNVNGSFTKAINIEDIAKGLYYIKVDTGSEVKMQKLIVQ